MILNNCRLIPELSGGICTSSGSVTLEDGKIAAVSAEPVSAELADFDCGGKTLLPGLIDLHTHVTLLGGVGMDCADDPMQVLVEAAANLGGFLDYGYTTIRDCGSVKRAANYARTMVNRGLIEGPDILSCGQTLMSSVVNKKSSLAKTIAFVDGAEEFRRGVREEAAMLPDFIKIYASGSAFNPTGVPLHPIMTEEEIRTAVETARDNGLYVAAHCHADSAIRACIENGVKTIEHATYISEETLDVLDETPDCYLVPTFSAMYVSQTDPAEREFWLARLTPMLEVCAKGIERAYRSGKKLGFGTDSAPTSPMYEKGVEFQIRKEHCHMENVDILLQATRYNAEIAGIDHKTGTIAAGLNADLILVDGKPDVDLDIMYGKPLAVWKYGTQVRGQRA